MQRAKFTQRDLRGEPLYKEVEGFFQALYNPGADFISDGVDICASPCGRFAGFTGTVFNTMAAPPRTRACIADLQTGAVTRITGGDGDDHYSDSYPRWAPDGSRLAFLSDRVEAGVFQLYLTSADGLGAVVATPAIEGMVEHICWSPDSGRILLVVAGLGADLAGAQGGTTTVSRDGDHPPWAPRIDSGAADNLWRWLCVYDLRSGEVSRLSRRGLNTWEGAWLGSDTVLAVASTAHTEGSWYSAGLYVIDVATGKERFVYAPEDQIGMPAGSPDGRHIAVIEAVCSDRLVVCGRLLLIDAQSGQARDVDTHAVDITHAVWRNDRELAYTGHREFETVVGDLDVTTGVATEQWAGTDRVFNAWYPYIWPLAEGGVVAIAQAYAVAPELVVVRDGDYRVALSLASEASRAEGFCDATIEPVRWRAGDGQEIHGLLVKPPGEGPFPLIMDIHGGPIWACRNRWMGNLRGCKLLADKGYASLYPNPRGSSTRGQAFARQVQGDPGGEDARDYLAGIDYLVDAGIADPQRIGVTGISYGGFMSAWLITQDQRFAAAVPISPICNWYSQHFTCQVPSCDQWLLGASPYATDNHYFHRSPAMHAGQVKTPTLLLAGARDQNTPPTQALEFHRALLENEVESVCTEYPTAGHGIRSFPEVIDHTTRLIGWFLLHMPPRG
ncbi:prolyl oligopeptidase family serine peptidase [Exilibacterium tricleocarpae]|uniref:Prolyl oligopeptidase family serine peptidase n=1 Tax=Exilibacterium tricleocarpae TaxID=2591008 RepID=A0A545T016_9GAMM|nr:S9 family peptidase [Exilibacterium tricleocarpae]TQV70519.1 prolyl oligopeptidase family serine peptidase [Exilibacterium tricleocarpae]